MTILRCLARKISIHAPRVGSDYPAKDDNFRAAVFQSTLPVWGATVVLHHRAGQHRGISIHAPRVGSDLLLNLVLQYMERFQSTLPVWGATAEGGPGVAGGSDFNPRSPCGERQARGAWRASG